MRLCAVALILLPFGLGATTNDLTSALQKGLFEEEANHNLEAAAQAYQAVSAQFDKDRKLAATAIFRLGEVYRKQGKTNEAVAQYERIVREFSDQQTLVTLSRQNLAGLRVAAPPDAAKDFSERVQQIIQRAAKPPSLTTTTDDEEKEIRRIQAMIQNSPDLINAARGEEGTPLYQAATKGQLQVAKFLIEHGAAVNAPNGISGKTYSGWTPLMGAASGGHKAMVELLLTHGADVKARDRQSRTALHQTAQRGFEAVIKTLLDHQADANARDDYEATPFHLAVLESPKAVIELLLDRGAEANAVTAKEFSVGSRFGFVSGSPLHLAVRRGEQPVVELLLDRKADVNAVAKGGMYGGRTPLQEAVSGGRTDLVELLLHRGADPNAGVKDLPLAAAALRQNVEIARLLLRGGAKPDLAGKTSQQVFAPGQNYTSPAGEYGPYTPLQIAVAQRDAAMVKLLLEFKADANAKDPWSSPPSPLLRWALGDAKMLEAFLDAGADVNATDGKGVYPLLLAAGAGNPAAVDLLLGRGGKTEVRGERGVTPLLKAIESGSTNCVASLLAAGADVNSTNNYGWSPLHAAVQWGRRTALHMLLAKGANPNVRDRDGNTPLDLTKPQRAANIGVVPPIGVVSSAVAPPPVEEPRATAQELADVLRQHGALEELPFFDRIEVRRPAAGYAAVAIRIGTNHWNEFRLLELLALHYGFLTTERNTTWEVNQSTLPSQFWGKGGCQFPDLSRVVIRRPDRSGPRWTEIPVNAAALLESGDCARDVKLQPGDIVELPEADHPVNEKWSGLPELQLSNLLHCVSRAVTVSVKGTPTEVRLSPELKRITVASPGGIEFGQGLTKGSFMLKSVLAQSRLLRASSDVSRVKVTRRADGKSQEWVFDCGSGNDPDLWLRDGDVIEVPDKQ